MNYTVRKVEGLHHLIPVDMAYGNDMGSADLPQECLIGYKNIALAHAYASSNGFHVESPDLELISKGDMIDFIREAGFCKDEDNFISVDNDGYCQCPSCGGENIVHCADDKLVESILNGEAIDNIDGLSPWHLILEVAVRPERNEAIPFMTLVASNPTIVLVKESKYNNIVNVNGTIYEMCDDASMPDGVCTYMCRYEGKNKTWFDSLHDAHEVGRGIIKQSANILFDDSSRMLKQLMIEAYSITPAQVIESDMSPG